MRTTNGTTRFPTHFRRHCQQHNQRQLGRTAARSQHLLLGGQNRRTSGDDRQGARRIQLQGMNIQSLLGRSRAHYFSSGGSHCPSNEVSVRKRGEAHLSMLSFSHPGDLRPLLLLLFRPFSIRSRFLWSIQLGKTFHVDPPCSCKRFPLWLYENSLREVTHTP